MITYYLRVPYEEKDEAKRLGARWDSTRKQWFINSNHPNLSIIHQQWSIIDEYDDEKENSLLIELQPTQLRTVSEIQTMDIQRAIRIIMHLKPSTERDQLDKWLFDIHYRKKLLTGTLTNRIHQLNNNICYREIIRRCFNGVDSCESKQVEKILPQQTTDFIKELHTIQPSLTGIFIDYLIRRIISEINKKHFEDNRSKWILEKEHSCSDQTTAYDNYTVKSLIKLCREKGIICYSGLNKSELIEYIVKNIRPKKCRIKIEDSTTICSLPICQYLAYQRVCNTAEYKTANIIPEILLVSLAHMECFGEIPKQDIFIRIYEILNKTVRVQNELIIPLENLCRDLIYKRTTILLNPILGNREIPADADLILDDILIDIKCTKGNNEIYEQLQLLGYAALAHTHNIPIHSAKILNLLQGTLTTYHLEEYQPDNWESFNSIIKGK